MHRDRTQVRIDLQLAAQTKQARLGSQLRVGCGPFRAADRAEQDRVRVEAALERRGGQRVAIGIDRDATEATLVEHEFVAEPLADGLQHAHALGGDFRTDTVPAEHRDARVHDAAPVRREVITARSRS